MKPGARLLDLRGMAALCGDPSIHLLEALEQLPPGGRLRVLAGPELAEETRAAIRRLVDAGLAELVAEEDSNKGYEAILVRKR